MRQVAWMCLGLWSAVAHQVAGSDDAGPEVTRAPDPAWTTAAGDSPASEVGPLSIRPGANPLEGPLVTDRPDFTESTLTIPAGHLQLETGYTFTFSRSEGAREKSHTFPELLLRVGLARDVELRVAWEGWTRAEEMFRAPNDVGRSELMSDVATGGSDLSLGFKLHLADQAGWRPDLGVIVAVDVPAGHDAYTTGDVDPFVGLLWAYDLNEDWAFAGNVNVALPTVDGDRIFEPQASVSLGYAITDEIGAYAEYYGLYPTCGTDADEHYLNGGFTFLITDDVQFDIRAGTGLSEDSDDFFAGAGLSIRY